MRASSSCSYLGISGVSFAAATSGTSEIMSKEGEAAGTTGMLAMEVGSSEGKSAELGVFREGREGILEWLE